MNVGTLSQRQFSYELSQAALFALAFAARTNDCSRVAELIEALKGDLRYSFVKWVPAHSPVRLSLVKGKIKGHIRRPGDANFKAFELQRAAEALRAMMRHSFILDVENAYPEASNARKKANAQFRGVVDQLVNPAKRSKKLGCEWSSDKLKRAKHSQLHWLFQDCTERIASGNATLAGPAFDLRSAIQGEWRRRAQIGDYFIWPNTNAKQGAVSLTKIDSPELGILGALGYRVGKTQGRTRPVRLLILDAAFSNILPPINGPEYMAEWGSPTLRLA